MRCKKCKTLKSNGQKLPVGTEIFPTIMEQAELVYLDAAKLPVATTASKVKVRRKKKAER